MKKTRLLTLILAGLLVFSLAGCQEKTSGPINQGGHDRDTTETSNNNDDDDNDQPDSLPPLEDQPDVEVGGGDVPATISTGGKNYTAEWDGTWLSDEYSDFTGLLTVEPAGNGDVALTFTVGDKTNTITGKEINYDEANYDYGSFVYAELENNSGATIRYSKEPDQTYISYDGKDPSGESDEYYWITFYRFEGSYHMAPSDFTDQDKYGKLSRKDDKDSDYFYADSEDFIVEYRKSDSMYNGNESVSCESYILTSYDANQCCMGWKKTKYIFENEEDAKACFDYQNNNYGSDYYKYFRDGSIVYQWYRASGYTKFNQVYGWYLDCHYCVMSSNEDYLYYAYFSKPISSSDFTLSMDDILYYRNVRGNHYCLDTKDASLEVYIGRDSTSLYCYCDGEDTYRGSGYNVVKVDGMKIYTVTNDLYYKWISSDNYQKAVIFQVYEFGPDEATVSEYQFLVDDVENSGLTLDNFMSKTADKTIIHRFDMTRLKNN